MAKVNLTKLDLFDTIEDENFGGLLESPWFSFASEVVSWIPVVGKPASTAMRGTQMALGGRGEPSEDPAIAAYREDCMSLGLSWNNTIKQCEKDPVEERQRRAWHASEMKRIQDNITVWKAACKEWVDKWGALTPAEGGARENPRGDVFRIDKQGKKRYPPNDSLKQEMFTAQRIEYEKGIQMGLITPKKSDIHMHGILPEGAATAGLMQFGLPVLILGVVGLGGYLIMKPKTKKRRRRK